MVHMGKLRNYFIYAGIFLVSMAIIAIEIYLNRMFSLTFWYHFAFLIISIALFGIGFGGMLVYFVNKWVKKEIELVLYILSLILAGFIVYSVIYANGIPLETNVLIKSSVHKKYFITIFLMLSIPFVLGGMIFSFLFTNFSEKIHTVYFADLIGGGIGAILTLLLFPGRGPILMSIIAGVFVLIAAVSFILAHRKKWVKIALSVVPIIMIFYFLFSLYPQHKDDKIRVSKSKKPHLHTFKKRVFDHWDNFSYVTVHDEGIWLRMFGDYATTTPIIKMGKNSKPKNYFGIFRNHIYPFIIRKSPENVAIIGAGGGKEVLMALMHKSKHIDAVEFNPTFYYLLTDKYKKESGNLVDYPQVNYINGEGRFFLESSPRTYDAIIFNNAISQTAASSGAYSLSESYLYTVEAFVQYIKKLKNGGILYLSNPYPDAPRFATVARAAFKKLGKENELKDSIIISWLPKARYKTCKIVIKKGKFSKKELNAIRKYAQRYHHSFLYFPGMTSKRKKVTRLILTDNLEKEYAKSVTEIRPSTDNWPFFTQRIKFNMKQKDKDKSREVSQIRHFYDQPFILIRSMAEEVAKICLIFLLVPLLFLNIGGLRKVKNKIGSILYFLALGMGFMFVEIIFIQKFILFLGHPIYSFSIVLSSVLILSGVGSFVSKRFSAKPHKGIIIALGGIILAVGLNILFFQFLASPLVSAPFIIRVLLSVILVGGAAFFMGFMMPLGIEEVSRSTPNAIPWMWAINGIFSVVSSFLSVYFSILWGFYSVLFIGLGIYGLGTFAFVLPRLIQKLKS